jgi:cytochrome c-type biogenesis protein CcmH/NrfG
LEAERILREEICENPENAKAWYALGGTLHLLERFEESEKALRGSIRFYPDNTNRWKLLADIMRKQRRDTEADNAYCKAEEIESRTKWNV